MLVVKQKIPKKYIRCKGSRARCYSFDHTIMLPKSNTQQVIQHIKQMVNNKKDIKTYIYALFNAFLDGIAVLFVSIFILVEMNLMLWRSLPTVTRS